MKAKIKEEGEKTTGQAQDRWKRDKYRNNKSTQAKFGCVLKKERELTEVT